MIPPVAHMDDPSWLSRSARATSGADLGDLRRVAVHPESEEGRKVPGLLEAYKAWQARQAALAAERSELHELREQLEAAKSALGALENAPAASAGEQGRARVAKQAAKRFKKAHRAAAAVPEELESLASAAGERVARKRLSAGMTPADAIAAGFERYSSMGGRLSRAQWRRGLMP